MQVTSLVENETIDGRDDLACEFGLSLHIRTAAADVLFDTGATGVFADNAAALGIDLAAVELAVLSHQHFDHGGGLERFFEVNENAAVHLRDCPVDDRFFKAFAVIKRPIGLDPGLVEEHGDRFRFVAEDTEVAPGVWLLTEIRTSHPRPRGNQRLFVETAGSLVPDAFHHESVTVVREEDGIAVFSGCSHSGILNMIDTAMARFPGEPVKAVFGGFHLIGLPLFNSMAASRSEVEDMARQTMDRTTGAVYTGHCTGKKAFGVLHEVMGDRLRPLPTGTTVEL